MSRRRDGRVARCARSSWRTSPHAAAARSSSCRRRRTSDSKKRSRTSSPSSPRRATTGWATSPQEQQQAIADLFNTMAGESPLVEPDLSAGLPSTSLRPGKTRRDDSTSDLAATIAALIHRDTGLQRSNHHYPGWLGVECPSVRVAVWMMRALVASNVLSRREGTVLFVPVNAATDPRGTIVSGAVARVYRCASARGVSEPESAGTSRDRAGPRPI